MSSRTWSVIWPLKRCFPKRLSVLLFNHLEEVVQDDDMFTMTEVITLHSHPSYHHIEMTSARPQVNGGLDPPCTIGRERELHHRQTLLNFFHGREWTCNWPKLMVHATFSVGS